MLALVISTVQWSFYFSNTFAQENECFVVWSEFQSYDTKYWYINKCNLYFFQRIKRLSLFWPIVYDLRTDNDMYRKRGFLWIMQFIDISQNPSFSYAWLLMSFNESLVISRRPLTFSLFCLLEFFKCLFPMTNVCSHEDISRSMNEHNWLGSEGALIIVYLLFQRRGWECIFLLFWN